MFRRFASLALAALAVTALPASRLPGFETGQVAHPPPVYSLRQLTLGARAVVLAAPVDPAVPTRFTVREVLRGRGVKVGDVLAFEDGRPHQLLSSDPPPLPKAAPVPRRVGAALLFLGPESAGGALLLRSGLRLWAEDGRVLVPEVRKGEGRYALAVAAEVDWSAMLVRVRADIAALEGLRTAKGLARPQARNRRLLDWVERHRREFGGPPAYGWGALETEVFDWVLASGRVEDCWAAVRLYAELNRGVAPKLPPGCFASRAGRALLLRVACSDSALGGDRVRALALLAERAPREGAERDELLDRLVPLLAVKDAVLRAAAARTICQVSHPGGGRPASKRALPALRAAYKDEALGPARDELAEAVCVVGGPGHWKELTGNPPGLLACLRDLTVADGQLHFWLDLRSGGLRVHEPPTLVLERVNLLGMAAETKRMSLPAVNLPRPWGAGWDGAELLLVEAPIKGLSAGNWRIRVEGTAGKDKQKWTAELKKFTVAAPPKKGPGPHDGPHIWFDK
jgi:hypothetical protein